MPTIGIAGAGLIGGSIALRAARLGIPVVVFDPDPRHAAVAVERLGAAVTVAATFAELAACSDTLVLAAPLPATLAQLAELRAGLAGDRHHLIVDVASVKAPIASAAVGLARFVATHPLAGSERSGPSAATDDLFVGRVWCYDARADARLRERAVAFVESMGARAVPIANDEHDRVVALTSHLPQVLATVLGAYLAERADREPDVFVFCGTGIRSMLRLAGSSWTVWNAVLEANALPLAQEVRRFATVLSDVANSLDAGEASSLEGRFDRAGDTYARLHANAGVTTGDAPER